MVHRQADTAWPDSEMSSGSQDGLADRGLDTLGQDMSLFGHHMGLSDLPKSTVVEKHSRTTAVSRGVFCQEYQRQAWGRGRQGQQIVQNDM